MVQAKEILQKIQRGLPVEYDNVTIEGDLNVSALDLPTVHVFRTDFERSYGLSENAKVVVSPISITNSKILGIVDFSKTKILKIISFLRTRFNQSASFVDARFNESDIFWGSRFNQSAYFEFARFNQSDNFNVARFNQSASFYGARFNQSASFIDARFNHSANFNDTRFNQPPYFDDARFNQSASFDFARFNQSAYFGDARFNQSASFWGAQFQSAYFDDARFNQSAEFDYAWFGQTADFLDVHFKNATLVGVQFVEDPILDDTWFNGTLSLYRAKYNKFNIRWSRIHDLAYDDTAYHLLIENFKNLGFTDDANECYYSYRCKHGRELLRQGKILNWFFDFLAWGTYGYGLRPERPLILSIAFILLGGIYFFASKGIARSRDSSDKGEGRLTAKGQEAGNQESSFKEVSIWESILLSATYFTSGASDIISSTPAEFTLQGNARYVIVMLRLSGWIFFVLFLASLARTVVG